MVNGNYAKTEKARVSLNGINVRVFFGKKHLKKHLCHHDKNYYYFWKSNIPIINLIVDSRNMMKVSIKQIEPTIKLITGILDLQK